MICFDILAKQEAPPPPPPPTVTPTPTKRQNHRKHRTGFAASSIVIAIGIPRYYEESNRFWNEIRKLMDIPEARTRIWRIWFLTRPRFVR